MTKIDDKGRFLIPREIRERLQNSDVDYACEVRGTNIVLKPIENFEVLSEENMRTLRSCFDDFKTIGTIDETKLNKMGYALGYTPNKCPKCNRTLFGTSHGDYVCVNCERNDI